MLAVVIAEGVAIVLLGVLVLGLLRSHALILKALHELGAGLELEKEAGTGVSLATTGGKPGPVPVELESGVVQAIRKDSTTAHDIVGTDLDRVEQHGHRHDARHPHPAGLPHQRLLGLPDLLGRVPGPGRRAR